MGACYVFPGSKTLGFDSGVLCGGLAPQLRLPLVVRPTMRPGWYCPRCGRGDYADATAGVMGGKGLFLETAAATAATASRLLFW